MELRELSPRELRLVDALVRMTAQYLDHGHCLYNYSMSAGERAFLVLEELGLVARDNAAVGRWTEAGRRFRDHLGIPPAEPDVE